jgi:2-polyprenyl-3-methyl-5-hydroxy-6-metoxy-1,4-benzoquinol methylase
MTSPAAYWEERARLYSGDGAGLRAVCSYGMPGFFNASIHLAQALALDPWLGVAPGTETLDVGCGVGRWSLRQARRGARVTGVDLSRVMLDEARRRAAAGRLEDRCEFLQADVASLRLGRQFSLVTGVTVLQHIVDDELWLSAWRRLATHLAPGGRLVLLEVAPDLSDEGRNHPFFRVRSQATHHEAARTAGLTCSAVTGVDPMPLKILFRPGLERLPRSLATGCLAALTLAGLPIEMIFGRSWVRASWHKVFVFTRG